jgi:cytochrome c-type biogenesis protein
MLAANTHTVISGAILLGLYSLGLGIPFLIAGALINLAIPLVRKMGRWARIFNYVGGALLIIMGFLLLTGIFTQVVFWFNSITA